MPERTDQTRLTRCWEMMTEDERRGFLKTEGIQITDNMGNHWWGDNCSNNYHTGKEKLVPAPCGAVWWRIEEMMGSVFIIAEQLDLDIGWRYILNIPTGKKAVSMMQDGMLIECKTFVNIARPTALLMAFEAWLQGRGENRGG